MLILVTLLKPTLISPQNHIAPPPHIPDEDCFLGFALIDVVQPYDGGSGPLLVPSKYQRPHSKKQLAKLESVAGPDGSGLRTLDFDNALYIAVDPTLFDHSCLTKSLYGARQRVTWNPGASSETMVLLAGSHRQQVSINLTEPQRKAIEGAEKRLGKLNQARRQGRALELGAEIEGWQKAMAPKSVWLTMLYDKGRLLPPLSELY